MEYSLSQFGLAVLVVSPPTLLPTPSLLASGAEWGGKKKALTMCQHCSAVTATSMCYQHCWGHISKTQHYQATMQITNTIPAKPSIYIKDTVIGEDEL